MTSWLMPLLMEKFYIGLIFITVWWEGTWKWKPPAPWFDPPFPCLTPGSVSLTGCFFCFWLNSKHFISSIDICSCTVVIYMSLLLPPAFRRTREGNVLQLSSVHMGDTIWSCPQSCLDGGCPPDGSRGYPIPMTGQDGTSSPSADRTVNSRHVTGGKPFAVMQKDFHAHAVITGQPIGLMPLNMFVIDKPAILAESCPVLFLARIWDTNYDERFQWLIVICCSWKVVHERSIYLSLSQKNCSRNTTCVYKDLRLVHTLHFFLAATAFLEENSLQFLKFVHTVRFWENVTAIWFLFVLLKILS